MNTYTFHINLYDLAFVGAIFTGLTFALQLWLAKRINRNANRLLAFALVTVVLGIARLFGIDMQLDKYFPHWSWLPLQFSLGLGPLIYFYVLKITRPQYKFRWNTLLHFIPLLLEQGALVFEIKENIKTGAPTYRTLAFHYLNPVLQVLAFFSVVVYLYYSFKLIERFYRRIKFNDVSDRHRYQLRWLHRALTAIGLVSLLWIPYTAFYFFHDHHLPDIAVYYPLYLLLAITMTGIAAIALFRPEIAAPAQATPASKLSAPAMLKQQGTWLKKAMETNLFYQDAELSLHSLARALNLQPNELSRIINQG